MPGRPTEAIRRGSGADRRDMINYARSADHAPKEARDVDELSLYPAGRADRVEIRRPYRRRLHLGIRRKPRRAAAALFQGQAAAMGCRRADRLVAGPRSREPDGDGRSGDPDPWLRHLEPHDRQGAPPGSPPSAGLADLAIHAWRAGRADCHREDRPDRPRSRRQVLRRDAGHGRGAACRSLFAPAARQIRVGLSDHPRAAVIARNRAQRQPLGHDL